MAEGSNTVTLLPISTRGIGMGVAHMYWMLSTCDYFDDAVPDICAMYRASLGLLEIKLGRIQEKYDEQLSRMDSRLQYMCEFPDDFETVPMHARSVADVINTVGYIEHETGNYVPAVHRREYKNDRYVPRTDNILFTNLRETVEALSDPNTPLEYRKSFFQNNPIPGARFENDLLLNPDEIIPPDFHEIEEDVGEDMAEIMLVVGEIELHFSFPQFRDTIFDTEGMESILISNTQSNLLIPSRLEGQTLSEYYTQCRPIGDVTDFWSQTFIRCDLTEENPATLLGEVPNMSKFIMTPFYNIRDVKKCKEPAFLDTGYQDICRTLFPPYARKAPGTPYLAIVDAVLGN